MNIQKIFNCLQGPWNFERTIISKNPDFPSGEVSGHASFNLISSDNNSLHYQERGEFRTKNGETFKVQKEYLYRYIKETDKIEKYFIEANGERLFYQLRFDHTRWPKSLSATAEHLCNQDQYSAYYEFLGNEDFHIFKLKYFSKGPEKDFQTHTCYTRSPILLRSHMRKQQHISNRGRIR